MTKVAVIIFKENPFECKVEYYHDDQQAVQSVLDFATNHKFRVVLLHGFGEAELAILQHVPGISVPH